MLRTVVTRNSKKPKYTICAFLHSYNTCWTVSGDVCDGASRHMPKARSQVVLHKGSYVQAAI